MEKLESCTELKPIKVQSIHISETDFMNNTNAAFSLKIKDVSKTQLVENILLERCNFISNYLTTEEAHGAIAIHVSTFLVMPIAYHLTPLYKIIVKSCYFEHNYVHNNTVCSSGNGVITLVTIPYFCIMRTVHLFTTIALRSKL